MGVNDAGLQVPISIPSLCHWGWRETTPQAARIDTQLVYAQELLAAAPFGPI